MVIIGFSDIITNSSSEVYCVYDEEGINRIKELVNSILEIAGSDKKFDDLFEISLIPDSFLDEDFYDAFNREPENEQELLEYALTLDQYDRPAFEGINVVAKNPKDKHAADLISYIDGIFQFREYYT
jgi:hypothetical protein